MKLHNDCAAEHFLEDISGVHQLFRREQAQAHCLAQDNEAGSKNPLLPAAGIIEEKGMEPGLSTSSKRPVWSMEPGKKWY